MTGYINPYLSDEETVARDTRLSRERASREYREAKREPNSIDAALWDSRNDRPKRLKDFLPIPGASRSGALDPSIKRRMLQQEREGLIELQRHGSGHLIGYRPIDNTNYESKED